ncbi:MAG: electron transfer flavoprotein subunit beta/FixA family protein [Planctomycetota bacterium]
MQIAVCVAVTPATDSRISIGPGGDDIVRADLKYELSAYDDFAVEEAIRLVEAAGSGEVHVITVGDGSQKEDLRKLLARGAHRGTILQADVKAADSRAIALALAEEIRAQGATVVFTGKQAVDGDNGQVPAQLAVALDWPIVNKISKLTISGDRFTAEREIEGGIEIVEGSLPCVFSAEKGLNDPRFPSLKGIMAAKKKPLDEKPVTLAEPKLRLERLELPAPRPEGRIVGEGAAAVPALVDLLKNEAKVI